MCKVKEIVPESIYKRIERIQYLIKEMERIEKELKSLDVNLKIKYIVK